MFRKVFLVMSVMVIIAGLLAVFSVGCKAEEDTAPTYTVYYHSNYSNGSDELTKSETFTYGEARKLAANSFERPEGLYFAGWSPNDAEGEVVYQNEQTVTSLTDKESIHLYARWGYHVTFDANEGFPVPKQQIVLYNHRVNEPKEIPEKQDWQFVEWDCEQECITSWHFDEDNVKGEITLYAKYVSTNPAERKYTVSFEANGGEPVPASIPGILDGARITEPAKPTQSGYNFMYWCTDQDLKYAYDFNTEIHSDLKLYAKWTEAYTVTFNSNNGTLILPQSVDKSKTAQRPADPVRANFTFGGWYSDINCYNEYDFSTLVTSNITLYAKWTIITFSVQFNSTGGSSVGSQTVDSGTKATRPSDPSRSNFNFIDWYSDESLTQVYNFAEPVTRNLILYAKWGTVVYTVTFISNGGTSVTAQKINAGDLASRPSPNPTRANYSFVDWCSDSGLTNQYDFSTPVYGNINLYAKWNIITYSVQFVSNGGGSVGGQIVNSGTTVTQPSDPLRADFTFAGWYSDIGLTKVYNFDDSVTGNLILYAKWATVPCTVTFESNGGSSVPKQILNSGDSAAQPVNPTKTNYSFSGWFSDPGLTQAYTFGAKVTSDITLYAKWTIITYTVEFNSNGGSIVSTQTVNSGTPATQPSSSPTKTYYIFGGWYSDSGLGTAYNFNNPVTGNIILYAKWNAIGCTITFNSNSGTAVGSLNYNSGTVATQPTAPTRPNYIFDGWYTDTNLTQAYNWSNAVTSSFTLNARWKCTITYNLNYTGAATNPTATVTTPATTVGSLPATPSRSGWTFVSWNTAANNSGSTFNASTAVNGDQTVYAIWKCTVTFNLNYTGSTNTTITVTTPATTTGSVPASTRTNWTLIGWNTTSTNSGTAFTSSTTVTGDITVYAVWQCTVIFSLNGPTGNNPTKTVTTPATTVTTASMPANPTWANYTFDAWYTATSGGSVFTGTTTVSGNITVYARWLPNVNATGNSASISTTENWENGTLTANVTTPNCTGAISYQWKSNGNNIYGATASQYVIASWDLGTSITVAITRAGAYGTLTSNSITISNSHGVYNLDQLNQYASGNIILVQNITITGAWNPGFLFSGATFDGNGKTITFASGVTFDTTSTYDGVNVFVGLFSWIESGAELKNLKLAGTINVTSNVLSVRAGAVAGQLKGGTIRNVGSTVNITVNSQKSCYVGGIAGDITGGTIKNCYNTGDVIVTTTSTNSVEVGGISGGASVYGGVIQYCWSGFNSIKALGSTSSFSFAGGIAGQVPASITYCVALNSALYLTNSTGSSGRIVAYTTGLNPTMGSNYGSNTMYLSIASTSSLTTITTAGSTTTKDGAGVTPSTTSAQSWWQSSPLWSASMWGTNENAPWKWGTTSRPVLWFE